MTDFASIAIVNCRAVPSGIKSVRLSILRRHKGRCWAFDGDAERFKRHRCGGSRSFRIGDRAEWSYLLPKRLPVGRYTIRVEPPLVVERGGEEEALRTWVAALERVVRDHPTQWFNFFDVWRPFTG